MSEWQHLIDKHAEALKSAYGIFTWTSQDELAWLAEEASKRDSVLEIGTYHGASAKVMARSTRGFIYCFDYHPDKEVEETALKNLGTEKNVRYWQRDAGVSAIKAKLAGELLPNDWSFDMVWIDDGHTYSDAVRDCLIAMLFKREKTLICGHDYYLNDPKNEVSRAVNDCFGKENVKFGPGSIWYL